MMRIQIGAIHYNVVEAEELAGESGLLYGDIDYGRGRIRLDAGMCASLKRVTLWHEILHGILHAAGIEQHDEPTIIALSHGVVQILRDNAALRE